MPDSSNRLRVLGQKIELVGVELGDRFKPGKLKIADAAGAMSCP